jgi:DNA-binding beta-propeller fold protein YncE
MASNLSAHYKLANNIDCSDTANWNSGKGFDPVGDADATQFSGSLDGAGHIISNLTIIRANDTPNDYAPSEDESYVGLFGATDNATINNVHIRDSKIKGYQSVGGIIGQMTGGTLSNSTVNITTADNSCDPGNCVWARYGYYGGGLVGTLNSGDITNSRSGGPVKGSGTSIGGLIGAMGGGTLTNAYSSSNTDGGTYVGGAVGYMTGGSISKVVATGNAVANVDEDAGKPGRMVGGFVGYVSDSTISDSYATGNATTDNNTVGGFAGYVSGNTTISNVYSSGTVKAQNSTETVGGLIGMISDYYATTTHIQNSFSASSIDADGTAQGSFVGLLGNTLKPGMFTNNYHDTYHSGRDTCYIKSDQGGTGNGEFSLPVRVAVDSSGNVYVADTGNDRIQKFDSSGNYVLQWGSTGSGNGQFSNPKAVAVDSSGNVYVADSGNSRIQKFDSSGNYVLQWGSWGNGNGQFYITTDIAIDTNNNIYVIEDHRVQKFDTSGNYVTQWGSFGTGNSQFKVPAGVATDSSGNVYVMDSLNTRVSKFNSSGTYIAQYPIQGSGIAVDASGNIYLTQNNQVNKYDSSGSSLAQFGNTGSGDGEFSGPFGVAVDTSGNIYVADTSNNRIQKLDSSGNYLWKAGGNFIGNLGCTAVNNANSDPTYFYNSAHEPFAGSWDTDVWHFSGSSYPTLHAIDNDEDGVADNIEDLGPNNGDGNNDGILDGTQSNVATFVDSVSGKYVTLVAPAGVTITATSTSTAPSDGSNLYKFGLVWFTISGITPGGSADISIFIPSDDNSNSFTARKYNNSVFSTISGATVSSTSIGGHSTLHLTYSIADGGSLDADGLANGSITDPVGLATTDASASRSTLASTGMNQQLLTLIAASIILTGFSIAGIRISKKRV